MSTAIQCRSTAVSCNTLLLLRYVYHEDTRTLQDSLARAAVFTFSCLLRERSSIQRAGSDAEQDTADLPTL